MLFCFGLGGGKGGLTPLGLSERMAGCLLTLFSVLMRDKGCEGE